MPTATEGKPGSRERLLAALANLKPLSQEDADMINNAVMEARERDVAMQREASHRERIMALRAKLNPISQEDADMINNAIMESREASIADNLPS